MVPSSNELEGLYQQAEREVNAGNLEAAVAAYERILEADADAVEAQLGYVRTLIQADRVEDAAHYLEPKRDAIDDGRLLAELGRIFYSQGRFADAAEVLRHASELQSGDGHIMANYGFALWQSGKQQEALRVLQEALPLVHDNAQLSANMGQIFMQLGMWNEAVTSLERYLLDYPNDLDQRVLLAFALKEAGWRDEAKTVLEEILTIDPDFAKAREQLEALDAEPESDEEPLDATTEVDALSFELPTFDTKDETSEEPVAAVEIPDLSPETEAPTFPTVGGETSPVETEPLGVSVPSDIGQTAIVDEVDKRARVGQELMAKVTEFLTNDDLHGAIAYLESERTKSEAPAEVLNLLGKLMIGDDDYETALELFREAIELDPFHPQAHSNLGVLLWQMGEFEEAVDILRKAIELDTEDMDARINLALICHQIGLYEEAIPLYTQYLERFPEDSAMRMELADCYVNLDEMDAALRELDTVLLLEPDNEKAQKRYDELSNAGNANPGK